jgi:hypothetical protein
VPATEAVTTLATTTTLGAPTDCIYIVQSFDNLTKKIKYKINATQQLVPNPPYTLKEIKAANPQFGINFVLSLTIR